MSESCADFFFLSNGILKEKKSGEANIYFMLSYEHYSLLCSYLICFSQKPQQILSAFYI